ncbi:DNA primase [Wukongibacter baidiensis]|uniref:DNA primase n=1 Tax=Wukongibacter baidiensis TaxID=1723361 RepID=UPI003D7F6503
MSIRYSDDLIEEVSQRNNIVDIISEYINLKKAGRNHKGLCPFHNEKTPSFVVSDDKQLFHCFGCGEAGNIINFVMKIENLDFIDAIELLAEKSNIDLSRYQDSSQNSEKVSKKNKLYEINREAAIFFYKNLVKNKNDGIKYLLNRGLTIDIIKKFGLGYAVNEWERLNRYLLTKGYAQELIYEAGLVIKRKEKKGYYDRFRNRVIFPIINTTKKIVGFGGRVLDDSVPKYLNSPESPIFNKSNTLYGLNLARNELGKEKKLVVVEGYTDVISLYQFGIKNAVATLGTSLTKNHAQLFKRYCEEVIIAYDADTAGEAATIRGMDILNEAGCKVKVISLGDKMDPDDYIRNFGTDEFKAKIRRALPLTDYKIEQIKSKYDLNSNEGRISFINESIKVIKDLKSPVQIDIYSKRLAEEAKVAPNVIKSEIYGNNSDKKNQTKYNRKNRNFSPKSRQYEKQFKPMKMMEKNGSEEIEKSIISLCLSSKTNYDKITSQIDEHDFLNENLMKVFSIIREIYKSSHKIDFNTLIDRLDIEEAKRLKEMEKRVVQYDDVDKTIEELLISLKRFKIDSEIKFIKEELKRLETTKNKDEGDKMKIIELLRKQQLLGKNLKNLRIGQID